MDQHYCLRWNKHLTNLTDVLISLLEREALCDVTLSVGNNKTIKAHQAILSACSPYFESIFIENTHPHPIMYMGNVDYEDLKAIIEYIYKGEVNIAQHSLEKFLKTAYDLQVKGLVETNNIGSKPENADEANLSTSSPSHHPDTENSICDNFESSRLDRASISGRFGNSEPHITYKEHDRKNDIDPRSDLSPITDQPSRKRRKVSSCDTPSLPLQSLSRHPSESQASSHSSFKLSPLPKSVSIEAEIEKRRKSPTTNSIASVQQQQPISIFKQEADEAGLLQLPPHQPFSHLSMSDDILHNMNHAVPSDSSENEQQMSHLDQGNEIDGSSYDKSGNNERLCGSLMRLTFERLSGGCNLHRCKLCGKVVTHIRNHYHVHFPGRFECPLCRATYTRSDNLRTHCKFKHPMFNPDTRKFENLMNSSIASQTAAIAAIAAANSLNAAASLNVAQSHNQSSE